MNCDIGFKENYLTKRAFEAIRPVTNNPQSSGHKKATEVIAENDLLSGKFQPQQTLTLKNQVSATSLNRAGVKPLRIRTESIGSRVSDVT
jgi:hypothetical protein